MQQNKKHIVIITSWFPPLQSVAVNRMLAFANYLDKAKYDISVITLNPGDAKEIEIMHDATIYRVENKKKFQLPTFNSSDNKWKHNLKVVKKLLILKFGGEELKNWRKEAELLLIEIHKKQPLDFIVSSFAPVEPHLVALNFIEKYPEIKWIADMRDEMSNNHQNSNAEKIKLREVEEKIAQKAALITTVSRPIVNYFKELYPFQKVEEIRNGYDHSYAFDYNFNETFTILFAGKTYGKIKPDTFFEALVLCENELPEKWQIEFVGTSKNFAIPSQFRDNIKFLERVPQEKSVEKMAKADVNLFILPIIERKGIFSGKIFDYLSVKKPILAVVDETDVAAELINKLNMGFVANFESIPQIKKAILDSISLWKKKEKLNFDEKEIEKLHRKHQVKKMEELLEKL